MHGTNFNLKSVKKPQTHLFIRLCTLLFLAVFRLAVRQLPQVRFGQRVQRFPDVVVVAAEGEVVGGVASGS